MRSKSIILIAVALGCGLVASIGISQVMDRGSGGKSAPKVETHEIYVAMVEIDIGVALSADNVKLESWPKDRVPEGSIAKLEQLEGQYARQRLYAGEPILVAKLMDSQGEAAAIKIPSGYRAMAIKVDATTGVSNLVRPGDRVDVLVHLRKGGEIPSTTTRTVLKDVRVFSANEKLDRDVDAEGKTVSLKNVSLLLTPEQVEVVMLAGELGKLSLSLRHPNDTDDNASHGANVAKILGNDADTGSDRASPGSAPAGNVLDFLKGINAPAQQAETAAPAAEVPTSLVQEPYEFKMTVHTPDGISQFRWVDPNSLPEEVALHGAPGTAPLLPKSEPEQQDSEDSPPVDETEDAPESDEETELAPESP